MLNALKSLKRIQFKAFIIILQLAIGLSILNTCFISYSDNKYQLDTFNKLLNPQQTYLTSLVTYSLNIDSYEWSSEEHQSKIKEKQNTLQNTIRELTKSNVIKEVNIYMAYSGAYPINEYAPLEYKETAMCSELIVNESFYNGYNIPIYDGRGFKSEDFEKNNEDTIPVIIGKGYMDKIKIGDIIERRWDAFENGHYNYEVIGFYDDYAIPAVFFEAEGISKLIYSNYFMIVPTNEVVFKYDPKTILSETGFLMEIESEEKLKVLENKLNSVVNEENLYVKVRPLKDDYNNTNEVLMSSLLTSLTLSGTLILISLIGIITCIIGEIKRRKKEYGIRISCGATLKEIVREQFFEVLFMVALSLMITFTMNIIKGVLYGLSINWGMLIVLNASFGIFISIIISIIPIIKLKKLSVIEITRGE